jgi:hypothetical protein
MTRELLAVSILGVLFLKPSGIGQQDFQQVACRPRREHRAAVSEFYDPRKESRVIDVGVSYDHRVQFRRVKWRVIPVSLAQLALALKQAAVHEHLFAIVLEQILGTGHGTYAAVKGDSRHTAEFSTNRKDR